MEVAAYVSAMTIELKVLVKPRRMGSLAYLLDLVRMGSGRAGRREIRWLRRNENERRLAQGHESAAEKFERIGGRISINDRRPTPASGPPRVCARLPIRPGLRYACNARQGARMKGSRVVARLILLSAAALCCAPSVIAAQKLKSGFDKGSLTKGSFETGRSKGDEGPTAKAAIDEETFCAMDRTKDCDIKLAVARGLFETGLQPRFPAGVRCPEIDEAYAISYTYKRGRENYHGGIDMPAPTGTPIVASAAGTVVAKYGAERSFRGTEIILRHSPEQTGLPLWIYTAYGHFDKMPTQAVGQAVHMGEILGPTGNTGRAAVGRKGVRRSAIHFAVVYSASENYLAGATTIIPANGQWMDPVALFRNRLPLDSYAMKALPRPEKQIPIPVMFEDGSTIPAETKFVWPYKCKLR